jgi:hypothetical protein
MTTATVSTSTAISVTEPVFSTQEQLALAGFLAGYTGLTREAYAMDLRQFTAWCQLRHLRLFQARRADIECFARDLEARGRARATITRRLCTIAVFYRYAVEEDLLEHSPAAEQILAGCGHVSQPDGLVEPGVGHRRAVPAERHRVNGAGAACEGLAKQVAAAAVPHQHRSLRGATSHRRAVPAERRRINGAEAAGQDRDAGVFGGGAHGLAGVGAGAVDAPCRDAQ